jgi:hypothetical protein
MQNRPGERIRKYLQETVGTSFLRANEGEMPADLNVIQKKWGGFIFSSLSDAQRTTGC